MNVTPGSVVQADEEIGQIWSPEQDNIVGNYMRALAEVAASSAELRIKMRVAQESLEAAKNYQRETEEAARLIDTISTASTSFRLEVMRERAAARKNVVTQETEIAEATTQLGKLDELARQVKRISMRSRERLPEGGCGRRSAVLSRRGPRGSGSR